MCVCERANACVWLIDNMAVSLALTARSYIYDISRKNTFVVLKQEYLSSSHSMCQGFYVLQILVLNSF